MRSTALVAMLAALLLASCTGTQQTAQTAAVSVDVEAMRESLIETDKRFSRMSSEQGISAAFIAFAADDVIRLRNGQAPIVGKPDLIASMPPDQARRPMTLEWLPTKAEVSASGDLGYTFGTWIMRTKAEEDRDVVVYGNYVTIWRRQADGSWKYVLDGGNTTPPPTR